MSLTYNTLHNNNKKKKRSEIFPSEFIQTKTNTLHIPSVTEDNDILIQRAG